MKYKKALPFLLLVILGFIPLLNLFTPGFPVTHDGQDHIARIANFYQNLTEGNIVPHWAANLNWGYGHPILMFLYPMSSYLASAFHLLGFTLVDSMKLIFGITFIASGVAMYLWIRNFLGEYAAFIAGTLYLFAPYRFIDLYVRGAIGEHVAFVFPPLVLYFLLKLSKKYSIWYLIGGSFSLAGFILSHNAISLMFLPIILFYSFYLILQSKSKKNLIVNALHLIVLGFGMSAFFWVPAFFEGKYTLRNIVTKGEYLNHFINIPSLIFGQWNYGGSGQFTVQIGIINLLILLSSCFIIFYLLKNKKKEYLLAAFLFACSLIVMFLMLPYSIFIWKKIMILQNFQFPWRFLSVVVFTTAVLGGIIVNLLPLKLRFLMVIIVVGSVLLLTKDYWHAQSYLNKPESFFTNVYYGTTDTGESAPIWSIRFMETAPKTSMEIIDGRAIITEIERRSTTHKYKVVAQNRTRIRENTLYFPGWNVYVNGVPVNIEFQDQRNRGLITFFVDKGENVVNIEFKDTKLRKLSNIFSFISLFAIIIFAIFSKRVINWKLWRL